ncbi:natural killer cell receptor 2B4 isoform X8 [Manis javanica]|uniref:natural killer cell receptor 2B4 isoform X8 n=1 Tax=Manis javanica TaxID=9974 RepID=UPI003C6D15AB
MRKPPVEETAASQPARQFCSPSPSCCLALRSLCTAQQLVGGCRRPEPAAPGDAGAGSCPHAPAAPPGALGPRLRFSIEDLTLHIEAAQHQDSGLYFLELTNQSGHVSQHKFQVSVFDHVEEPRVLGQWKALDTGKCQVTLSCLVSRGGDVSYAWYRGSEMIRTSRNLTRLEVQIDINSLHTFTCNVSNPVSWADNTLTLTPGCLTGHQKLGFLPFLVAVVILLVSLFLGTLTCFCVRRRKREKSETSPEELLTIYEDVKNPQIRRNQRQKQNSPGEGATVYSVIQSQPSASTSQETTLYSLVQPSRKSGTKKKSHGPSLNNTVYDEVGRREPRAQNPVRLSCKELESFYMYS